MNGYAWHRGRHVAAGFEKEIDLEVKANVKEDVFEVEMVID